MSIKNRVNFGIKWLALSLGLVRAARFLTTIILARLLVPEMFGIMAMANATIELLQQIREVGIGSAYIQKKYHTVESDRYAANTTFYIGLIVNLFLFCFAYLLAPFISNYFSSPDLVLVLRVMFLSFFLDALTTVPFLVMQKRLEFGKTACTEVARSVSYAIIGVTLAFTNFGVWSLVFAQLGSKLLIGMLAFKLSGWLPKWEFDIKIAKELFKFGKYIWAFVLVSAIGGTIDKAIVGRVWGAASLGFYNMTFNITRMPMTLISFLINKITFPVFSRLQDDTVRLHRAMVKIVANIAFVSMPISVGLIAVADEFVITALSERWISIIPLMKVMCFYTMLVSISSVLAPCLKSIGKPNLYLYANILNVISLIVFLFLLRHFGVIGVCYAQVASEVVSFVIIFKFIVSTIKLSPSKILVPILRSGISSVVMFLAIEVFTAFVSKINSMPSIVVLASNICIGIFSYLIVTFTINRVMLDSFRISVIEILKAKGT